MVMIVYLIIVTDKNLVVGAFDSLEKAKKYSKREGLTIQKIKVL